MKNFELGIENGVVTYIKDFEEENGIVTKIEGNLHIPAEVTDIFANESIIGVYPEDITVDENNEVYCAKEHCLFTKDGKELLLISKKSTIPADTKIIGNSAFALSLEDLPVSVDSLKLPEGLEKINYRGLAFGSEQDVCVEIPSTVNSIGLMALMIRAPKTTFVFEGDLELETGVFGTRAEALDLNEDIDTVYKDFPDMMYIKPENIMVIAGKNTKIAAYCKKYGIPCECR